MKLGITYERAKQLEGWPIKMRGKRGSQHLGRGILVEVLNEKTALVRPFHRHRTTERMRLKDLLEWTSGMQQFATDTGKELP